MLELYVIGCLFSFVLMLIGVCDLFKKDFSVGFQFLIGGFIFYILMQANGIIRPRLSSELYNKMESRRILKDVEVYGFGNEVLVVDNGEFHYLSDSKIGFMSNSSNTNDLVTESMIPSNKFVDFITIGDKYNRYIKYSENEKFHYKF